MTLHLTQASDLYVLQVGDRLVSGGIRDPLANKNIIYWARDAIVTMGYTGLAYDFAYQNRSLPTDEWIVEKLRGRPIPRGRDGIRPAAISNDNTGRWLDIGETVKVLKIELESALQQLTLALRRYPFELTIAGWHLPRRGRIKPLVIEISKAADDDSIRINRPKRYWHYRGKFGLWATPREYVSGNEAKGLASLLASVSPSSAECADQAEEAFVKHIRLVAARTNTVGPNCMSILLPRPDTAPLRVRFIPAVEHRAALLAKGRRIVFAAAYTPWIVGPSSVFAPAINLGKGSIQLGRFRIDLEAPESEGGLLSILSSVRRPTR